MPWPDDILTRSVSEDTLPEASARMPGPAALTLVLSFGLVPSLTLRVRVSPLRAVAIPADLISHSHAPQPRPPPRPARLQPRLRDRDWSEPWLCCPGGGVRALGQLAGPSGRCRAQSQRRSRPRARLGRELPVHSTTHAAPDLRTAA